MNKTYLFMVLSIFLVWQGGILIFRPPPFLIPPPYLVTKVLLEEANSLLEHTAITVVWAAVGYAIANIIAISLAISFVYFKTFEKFATPWMVLLKNVPFVTFASILIVTLGDTPVPKVTIIVLITVFPIQANIVKGLKSVNPVLLDRMKVLSASTWQVFWKVKWPAAMPYYIASHEIAATGSIIGAIVAEYLFARDGLGFLIVRAMSQYRADRIWAITLISSILSIGVLFGVQSVENRLFRYRKEISS